MQFSGGCRQERVTGSPGQQRKDGRGTKDACFQDFAENDSSVLEQNLHLRFCHMISRK